MFCSHYDMLEKNLAKRGFIVHQAKDANEAKQLAFSLIKPNESVGFGGSVTVLHMCCTTLVFRVFRVC